MLKNNNKYEELIVFELNSYIEMKLYIYIVLCKNVSFLTRKKEKEENYPNIKKFSFSFSLQTGLLYI